ncbi:MAG: hypothetical protein Q9219_002236 [cf. Caloplaca sp. 3 TL-2023]
MAVKKKRKKARLLSNTRPRTIGPKPSLSSQTTRSLIRKHHNLQKQLQIAVKNEDNVLAEGLRAELAASGGLQKYQEASIQGQSAERGGDTSRVLVEWMNDILSEDRYDRFARSGRLRMLEVGALKVDNACSRSKLFDMTRIDLHSQHPEIRTQDFMEMSIPAEERLEKDGFDIVSLSLVINYISDAVARGAMLQRVASFFRNARHLEKLGETMHPIFPALFLVLPAPCVMNSRYLDEERLGAIMTSLGYKEAKKKLGKKLVYYLWNYKNTKSGNAQSVHSKKQEVRSGGQRNNFTIVLQ